MAVKSVFHQSQTKVVTLLATIFSLDIRNVIAGGIFGIIIPMGFFLLQADFRDASRYYVMHNIQGPFAVITAGTVDSIGPSKTHFVPGEDVGIIVDDCLLPNIKATSISDLVELKTGYVISSIASDLGTLPEDKRCGVHKLFRPLPHDLEPGDYQIRRRIIIFPPNWGVASTVLPGINIRIVKGN